MDWKPAERQEEPVMFPEEWAETADPGGLRQAKRAYGRIAWFAFLLLLAAQLGGTVLVAAAMFLKPSLTNSGWFLNLVSTGPLYLVALPLCWLLIRKLPRSRPVPDSMTKKELLHLVLICIFLTYACNMLGSALLSVLQLLFGVTAVNPVDELLADIGVWETLLFMVIIAPFGEEFIFRKLIVDRLRDYGEKPAILVSALIFGLFHGNLTQFPYAFALGTVFAYAYLRTGQLRYTILLHMAVNTVGGLLPVLVLYPMAEVQEALPFDLETMTPEMLLELPSEQMSQAFAVGAVTLVYGLFLIGACIAGLALLLQKRKDIFFLPMEQEIPRGRRFRVTCVNAGMVLLVVAFLGMTAMFFIA